MAYAEAVYREAQARLHRILGSYLAMKAWAEDLDCVILERKSLLSFLDLERMRNARVDWLKDDLSHLFKYANTTNTTKTGVYASLYLSRVEIPKNKGIWKTMNTKERVNILLKNNIKTKIYTLPSERSLLKKMALISQGIDKP